MADGDQSDAKRPDRKPVLSARKRWKMLAEVLKGKANSLNRDTETSSFSVRRFSSFGLLRTKELNMKQEERSWYAYSCSTCPDLDIEISQYTGYPNLQDIVGFNNTGNVCIWPSEEILTYYCLKHKDMFSSKSVCELGGGMTCLAGVALAAVSDVKHTLLTDGNPQSVKNVEAIIERNRNTFGKTEVLSRILVWVKDQDLGDLKEKYDYVICADCFFFDQYREGLAHTIYNLLKPEGRAIIFAPTRGNTFQSFMDIAQGLFLVKKREIYDDVVWKLHEKMKSKGIQEYDENLHYPILLELTKTEESKT